MTNVAVSGAEPDEDQLNALVALHRSGLLFSDRVEKVRFVSERTVLRQVSAWLATDGVVGTGCGWLPLALLEDDKSVAFVRGGSESDLPFHSFAVRVSPENADDDSSGSDVGATLIVVDVKVLKDPRSVSYEVVEPIRHGPKSLADDGCVIQCRPDFWLGRATEHLGVSARAYEFRQSFNSSLQVCCLDNLEIVGECSDVVASNVGPNMYSKGMPGLSKVQIRFHLPISGLVLPSTVFAFITTAILFWLAIDSTVRSSHWRISTGSLVPALVAVPTIVSVLLLRTGEHRLETTLLRGLRETAMVPAAMAAVAGFMLGIGYAPGVEEATLWCVSCVSAVSVAMLVAIMAYWPCVRWAAKRRARGRRSVASPQEQEGKDGSLKVS